VQRSEQISDHDGALGFFSRLARFVADDGDVCAKVAVALLYPPQKSLDDLDRREVAAPDPRRQLGRRRKAELPGHALTPALSLPRYLVPGPGGRRACRGSCA
jgi:hypothetical protein